MPPTNDTGSVLTVGPDVNGDHFSVDPGESYELPEPPRTVSDEEAEARTEEEASEPPEEDLGHGDNPPPEGETPPGADTELEGLAQPGEEPPVPADTEGTPE